ncbi:hypothetical protein FRC12_019571, partial [Ceratobasidium sp. 428]
AQLLPPPPLIIPAPPRPAPPRPTPCLYSRAMKKSHTQCRQRTTIAHASTCARWRITPFRAAIATQGQLLLLVPP